MRWPSWTPDVEYRIRIALLAIAVLVCVALPYAVVRSNAEATDAASVQVVKTAGVKQKLFQLRLALREIESLVITRFAQVQQAPDTPDYQTLRGRIAPLLATLSKGTEDNIEQQNRVGALGAVLTGRLKMYDEAIQNIKENNYDAAATSIRQAAQLFGSRGYSLEIMAFEDDLYAQRTERLASLQRTSRWAMTGAMIAQLLLLGGVLYISERQAIYRRKAESLARLAVERSRLIVKTLREPIAVLDQQLNVLMTNQAFSEFYGRSVEEQDDIDLSELGEGAWNEPELRQRLLDVGARGREIWDFELEQRSSDGIERIVLVNARRMDVSSDADVEVKPSILLTVSDVTARRRYEERITELNDDLEIKIKQVSEINRELESFSYSVSHDLRAPLRHIAGFSDKLDAHLGDHRDEKSRHYLDVIGGAARRMSALIEDLLEYSRLGRNAFHIEPVNMNALISEVCEMLRSSCEERSIDWQLADLPNVIGDESMLRRVWQNLIGNAIKYTERREHAVIEIGLADSAAGENVFYVRDNGVGFNMAYAGKLFGVFQRLHKPSEFAGTGIGLANVRRIILRHGGRTWAEAEQDKGATIYFSLPVSADAIKKLGIHA